MLLALAVVLASRPLSMRTRATEVEAAPVEEQQQPRFEGRRGRGPRRDPRDSGEEKFKHNMPLPLPAHLVYIRPTVAVVTDRASRSSVGLKMTAGGNQLERYVVEYFARSVK
jgi:hypothetical protein